MTEHKHQRISRLLRQSLGEPGSTLPSESDLAARYGASRPTIRQALKALADEGLITSTPGSLRRVREIKRWTWDMSGWEQPAQHRDYISDAWAHTIRTQGGEPSNDMRVEVIAAPTDVAHILQIEPGTAIQARYRRRMVNDQPHQLSDSYFPPFVTDNNPLFWEPGDTAAPGGLLAASGHPQARWHDALSARMPSADEAQQLRMSSGTPLLIHSRIGYDKDDRPVRYMVTRMAADQVEVTYDLDVE